MKLLSLLASIIARLPLITSGLLVTASIPVLLFDMQPILPLFSTPLKVVFNAWALIGTLSSMLTLLVITTTYPHVKKKMLPILAVNITTTFIMWNFCPSPLLDTLTLRVSPPSALFMHTILTFAITLLVTALAASATKATTTRNKIITFATYVPILLATTLLIGFTALRPDMIGQVVGMHFIFVAGGILAIPSIALSIYYRTIPDAIALGVNIALASGILPLSIKNYLLAPMGGSGMPYYTLSQRFGYTPLKWMHTVDMIYFAHVGTFIMLCVFITGLLLTRYTKQGMAGVTHRSSQKTSHTLLALSVIGLICAYVTSPNLLGTITEVNAATRINHKRLRKLMRDGVLRGYISPRKKVYRPSWYSVFRHVLNFPVDDAMRLAAEISGSLGSSASPSPPVPSDRQSSTPQNRRECRGANSPRRSAGPRNGKSERQQSSRRPSTNRSDPPDGATPEARANRAIIDRIFDGLDEVERREHAGKRGDAP